MRFAGFEVDERGGTITRDGVRIKLQDLPFRLLITLLKRAGDVVTREELRAALWGSETFVDAEAGLNTAIAKIREALGDNAETPAFIETLPRRGYRFIGSLTPDSFSPSPSASPSPNPVTGPTSFIVIALTVAEIIWLIWALAAYVSRPASQPLPWSGPLTDAGDAAEIGWASRAHRAVSRVSDASAWRALARSKWCWVSCRRATRAWSHVRTSFAFAIRNTCGQARSHCPPRAWSKC
jgi:DNA-binding winged helix-turn-helix (wHTH) protein